MDPQLSELIAQMGEGLFLTPESDDTLRQAFEGSKDVPTAVATLVMSTLMSIASALSQKGEQVEMENLFGEGSASELLTDALFKQAQDMGVEEANSPEAYTATIGKIIEFMQMGQGMEMPQQEQQQQPQAPMNPLMQSAQPPMGGAPQSPIMGGM